MTQLSYDTQIGLDFILVDSSDGASPLAPQAGAVL